MNRHTSPSTFLWLVFMLLLGVWCLALWTAGVDAQAVNDLQIEVTKKGAGKQVVISQGAKEWFMLIEVTPENAVILKQEKDRDRYLLDESETHDRPMTAEEVDAAITAYVDSVKNRARKK